MAKAMSMKKSTRATAIPALAPADIPVCVVPGPGGLVFVGDVEDEIWLVFEPVVDKDEVENGDPDKDANNSKMTWSVVCHPTIIPAATTDDDAMLKIGFMLALESTSVVCPTVIFVSGSVTDGQETESLAMRLERSRTSSTTFVITKPLGRLVEHRYGFPVADPGSNPLVSG